MALWVVAHAPADFDAWLAHERGAAAEPTGGPVLEGYLAFRTLSCVFCHTIRGLQSFGVVGPDLTHVGSRLTIGAGLLATDPHNIALWIAHNQSLKPGNDMLSFDTLDPHTLQVLATFLESLK